MVNLLNETIEILNGHGKTENDVIAVLGTIYIDYGNGKEVKTSWENFKKYADFTYNEGFGGNEISIDLKIVGKDFWLERGEYDGSEWWEFKTMPSIEDKEYIDTEKDVKAMVGNYE